ncbi:MAG TPA: 4'-phosphopantetheinyl transferase superfamily protein [Pyrinomonadaceae bacterium]|nr:4'-phosphopantetheinyl transferase superfamily protein [Pyrinomonadaceae bacterium]
MATATATRTKTDANAARGNDDAVVGLLEVCELRGADYAAHLSEGERAKYAGLAGERRRGEWLAGRLAAKFLFLNRLGGTREPLHAPGTPYLLKISSAELAAFSPWMYRAVEILSDEGAPGLVWCGRRREEKVSLSHTGGVACACLSPSAPVAVDIETVAPREDAFYRKNFDEAERNWVARHAVGRFDAEWHFTLLWSLKESALKLGWLNEASLWTLPRVRISGLPELEHVGPVGTTGDRFASFAARVEEDGRVTHARVAAAGTHKLVLTTMGPLMGGFN